MRIIGQINGEMTLLREHTQPLLDMDLTRDSKLASTSCDDTARLWDLKLENGEIMQVFHSSHLQILTHPHAPRVQDFQ